MRQLIFCPWFEIGWNWNEFGFEIGMSLKLELEWNWNENRKNLSHSLIDWICHSLLQVSFIPNFQFSPGHFSNISAKVSKYQFSTVPKGNILLNLISKRCLSVQMLTFWNTRDWTLKRFSWSKYHSYQYQFFEVSFVSIPVLYSWKMSNQLGQSVLVISCAPNELEPVELIRGRWQSGCDSSILPFDTFDTFDTSRCNGDWRWSSFQNHHTWFSQPNRLSLAHKYQILRCRHSLCWTERTRHCFWTLL